MKDYAWYVKAGKDLVTELNLLKEKTESYQFQIAKFAVGVCTIRHGGRSEGIYTLKKYATDIGINHKTIQNWTATYRIYTGSIDAEANTLTPKEWMAASRLNNLLKKERAHTNRQVGREGSRHAYKQEVPKDKVENIYRQLLDNEKPFIHEFFNMENSLKHNLNVLKTRDLSIIPDHSLLHVMTLLDEASEVINQYLTNKKKQVA